jgi:uncharacterized RDD family membrane protein YckC
MSLGAINKMTGGFLIFAWLYFALSESSAQQGTLGKRLLKLVVIDMKGNRISFGLATWRFILIFCFTCLNIYGVIIDCIPYLLKKKRSLQQVMSGTIVIKHPNNI